MVEQNPQEMGISRAGEVISRQSLLALGQSGGSCTGEWADIIQKVSTALRQIQDTMEQIRARKDKKKTGTERMDHKLEKAQSVCCLCFSSAPLTLGW